MAPSSLRPPRIAWAALDLSTQVIEVNGVVRRFLVAAPSGAPSIIVLSLHGAGPILSDKPG